MTAYTSIFGNYDDLKLPLVITPGWKYICFTDQPLVSDVWEIVQCPIWGGGPRRTSKLYKVMFHKFIDDEVSLYMDASFVINCNLDEWMKRFKAPFTLMKHPRRRCVYQEALTCIKNQRDRPEAIQAHIQKYRRMRLPKNNGMAATGIMMRRRCEQTIKFAELWMDELMKGCKRDQISWAYAHWKFPGLCHFTDYDYRFGTDFLHVPHLRATSKRQERLLHYKSLGYDL